MFDKDEILNNLNSVGICVLEDYFTSIDCDECVSDIDRCIVDFSDKVQRETERSEGCSGDERLFKCSQFFLWI